MEKIYTKSHNKTKKEFNKFECLQISEVSEYL